MNSRLKKYKLTGKQLSELLGVTESTCQGYRRFNSGIPDTDDPKVILDWYKNYKKKVSSRNKKLKEYKLSNKIIAEILKLTGKRTGNKVSELRYAGLPDTTNHTKVKDWYEVWKGNQPNLVNLATLQSIGDALGLTRERVRQLKNKGMPFNESPHPIEDARAWYELKYAKKNIRCKIRKSLGIDGYLYSKYVKSGMPPENLERARLWIDENTNKTPKFVQVYICKSLGIKRVEYSKFVKIGMPPENLKKATDWIKVNTFQKSDGELELMR